MPIRAHQELEVQCTEEQYVRLTEAIERHLPAGWRRDQQAERRLRNSEMICFFCAAQSDSPDAQVWLTYSADRNGPWVANILAERSGGLEIGEYNKVLRHFFQQCIRPAADELRIQASLSREEVTAEDYGLSPRSVSLLRRFASSANDSTGSSHPRDRQRWFAFLISAHKDEANLDTTTLGQLLMEEYDWPENTTSDLQIEYEFARGILAEYDSEP
jgi:hypothetical protein